MTHGTISLTWTLTNTAGQPITCGDVGAQNVVLVLRNILEVGGSTAVFGCGSGGGTTTPLSPGPYEIDFELRGTADLLAASPRRRNIVVVVGQDTPIGAVPFAVDAIGGFELVVRASPGTTNCGTGTNISAMAIALRRPDDTCQLTTLRIEPGGRTYPVNCASMNLTPCVENNQRVIATDLPSGSYKVEVVGRVGARDCWTASESLQVPPLRKSLSRTVLLAKAPGC